MIGTRLNHYEIVRKLGSGGMGDVYAARDGNLGREVALKILPPAMARDAERLERFRREATTVAALDHPNIVTIFSIEEAIPDPSSDVAEAASATTAEPVHFLTMQLVEGKTLDDVIPRRGLSLDRFFEIAVPLADAVAAAHDKGVTHRDLKPTNIMVTPEGRVKVLDFGLAKLAQPDVQAGDKEATQAATMTAGPITEEGKILGTAAYMSPEQAEGLAIDHRTDIFSLGIILYEMATGEAPFRGDSRISILSSVVNDEPEPVSEINRTAPRHLGRIIGHSLEKDPKRRFQSALDLRNELEGLKGEVDSGSLAPVASGDTFSTNAPTGNRRIGAYALIGVMAIFVVWLGFIGVDRWLSDDASDDAGTSTAATAPVGGAIQPVSTADERPSIAVLYFDNVSGDPDLDWLRTGLPEMLVTDLSQSRAIRVLPTDRLFGILSDAGMVDAPASEALDTVGSNLGVDRVLLGSVLRAGDHIRITARLQDVTSGDIVASESLDGDSEEDLFALVDRLTRSVRATFTGLSTGTEVDRDVTEVTTSSIAALRLWVEANRLMDLAEYGEARDRLQRAVEIDPDFAVAYAKLAAISRNTGDVDAGRAYAEAALQNADHLTARERYYVEGTYYYSMIEQSERSAAAYTSLLEFDPSSTAARNNLALVLSRLGREDEAIAHFEALVADNVEFVGTWTNLADLYANQARFDEAEALMQRLAEQRPESGVPYDGLAGIYLRQGRYDDVLAATGEALRRDFPWAARFRVAVAMLTRRWQMAEEVLADNVASDPATLLTAIPQSTADLALYRGDSSTALSVLEDAVDAVPERGSFTSWLNDRIGYVHEARGDLDAAVAASQRSIDDSPGSDTLVWEIPLQGRLQAMAGRLAAARATAARYATYTSGWPEPLVSRHRAMVDAAIAKASGDPAGAARILEQTAAALDPSGFDDSPHVYIWFDLANAHLAAGDQDRAAAWLQRIVDASSERVGTPYEYVYALYLLGNIHAERGEETAARARYELFLEYWGNGDLRRAEVEVARGWLAAH